MFNVKYCKVLGFQEALDILKLSGCPLPDDSYTTYIEDEKTLETAPYQFVLGEKDAEYIKNDKNLLKEFLRQIRIYACIDTDVGPGSDYFITYFDVYCAFESAQNEYSPIGGAPEFRKHEFYMWVDTLPYSKALGLMDPLR